VAQQPNPHLVTAKYGQLRIIGGTWRSRKLPFAAFAGVRPTPDRVRETVFNWLQSVIPGAHCLDLFAGSGAFGFEALSRGAAAVVMVDHDLRVIQTLQKSMELLQAGQIPCTLRGIDPAQGYWIEWADAREFLQTSRHGPFDMVFLDPPYRENLNDWVQCLDASPLLASSAWIYLEASSHTQLKLPDTWRVMHSKTAGEVGYHLAQKNHA